MSDLATALARITRAVEEHGTGSVWVRYDDLVVLVRQLIELQERLQAAYSLADEDLLRYLLLGSLEESVEMHG